MTLPPQAEIPEQLSTASAAWIKLRRVASYAAFDGWTLTVLGALNLICGGYGSVLGVMLSLALLGAGLFELRSVRRLRRLNPSAITHLAYNQLFLAAVLILYALISMIQARGGGGLTANLQQALAQAGGSTGDVNDQISTATDILYAAVIAIALFVQGGTALYYFSRQKHLQRYLQQTPPWIQQMQRERGEISL